MKRALASCIISATTLAAGQAAGQNTNGQTWVKEPDAFLGIRFGELLSDAIPRCPEDRYALPDFDRIRQLESICLRQHPTAEGYFSIHNLPSLGFTYSVTLKLEGGKPAWFAMTADHENFGHLATALSDRYGAPSTRAAGTVQTRAGATHPSQTYTWAGKRVQITLNERQGTLTESAAMITDLEVLRQRMQQMEDANKAGASKL